MYRKTGALQNYGRIANSESDPIEQLVMLYDGAIKFLRHAANDIDAMNLSSKAENTNRALDIISYLQSILDFEKGGEVAANLDNFYNLVTWTIVKASASLQSSEMNRAAALLAPVRDSWAQNARAAHPVSLPTPYGSGVNASLLATA